MKCYIKDYPRPQFVRSDWQNLNGKWNFVFDDNNEGENNKYFIEFPNSKIINVPFTYETELSGINEQNVHYIVWYNRTFTFSKTENINKKVIINFEGSDYLTKVWINGNMVGVNKGAYSRFSFDISNYLVDGENNITIKIEDSLSKNQPRGKQRYKKESWSCHYIQTTGIWKTVWLEFVPQNYIMDVKNTPNVDNKSITFEYETNISEKEFEENEYYIETDISFNNNPINKYKEKIKTSYQKSPEYLINNKVELWSPNAPNLYDIEYKLYRNNELIDTVKSYFGVRKIEVKNGKILLNGEPIYIKAILDQGYWKTSHLTPPNEQSIIKDIEIIKKYGFNSVRKHQKNEDERFYYYCDLNGILVWSEMANCFDFNDESVNNFTNEWTKVVKQNYNHPSIIIWVPINESWGVPEIRNDKKQQSYANTLYYLTKSIDETRLVISNDGWEHTTSDIITIHDYEQDYNVLNSRYNDKEKNIINNKRYVNEKLEHRLFADGFKYENQPIIMSEYGGIALQSDKGWGYGKQVESEEKLIERYDNLTQTIKNIPYISGYCYTQLTDVQQEVNGLVDESRNEKISYKIIKEINDKCK